MDFASVEDSRIVKTVCSLALAAVCLTMWFRFVLNRTLNTVSRSLTGGLIVVENIDSITHNLDALSVNQRAFLSTGDELFAVQIAESVMAIGNNLESLKQISVNGKPLRPKVTSLSHRINWALDSIERTYDLQQHSGTEAAIALLDNGDALWDAKREALSLKQVATDGIFGRVQTERGVNSILEELF